MAKIRNFEETQKALEAIQLDISQLRSMKEFLKTDNPSKQYEICFKIPISDTENEKTKNKKIAVKFQLSDRDTLKLVLSEHEEALCNEIRSLASQYQIDLEPEEEALLQ